MLRNIFCWKGFGPVTGPISFPGANFQQMVIARLSLGLSFLGLRNFLKLCHDEKPCTWWLGEKGLGSLQSRLARMLHHEYDALKGYRFLGGAISFYSVSCMSDVMFNPSLLNWSSLILTVAHMDSPCFFLIKWSSPTPGSVVSSGVLSPCWASVVTGQSTISGHPKRQLHTAAAQWIRVFGVSRHEVPGQEVHFAVAACYSATWQGSGIL